MTNMTNMTDMTELYMLDCRLSLDEQYTSIINRYALKIPALDFCKSVMTSMFCEDSILGQQKLLINPACVSDHHVLFHLGNYDNVSYMTSTFIREWVDFDFTNIQKCYTSIERDILTKTRNPYGINVGSCFVTMSREDMTLALLY